MKSIVENFTLIYDKCFLLRSMKAKGFNQFVNPGILKALLNLKVKDASYTSKSFLNSPKSSTENAYKSCKNRHSHSLRVGKCLYYEKQLQKLKSNTKVTWRVLNQVLNRNKGKDGFPSIFRALRFSRHFQSWGNSLSLLQIFY